MEIQTMDASGIVFLTREEGLRLEVYRDKKNGVPTIGYGSTYWEDGRKVKMTDLGITKYRATNLLRITLKHYELTVYSTTRDDINQNQFNALVDMCYNVGVQNFKDSTLLKLVNQDPEDLMIGVQFMRWNKDEDEHGNLVEVHGLTVRCTERVKLYFTK